MEPLNLSIYPKISGEEWRKYIEKELKDLSWRDLNWESNDELVLEAGYHSDDKSPMHFLPNLTAGDWLIGERFDVEKEVGEKRSQLLEALNMGLDAPLIAMTDYNNVDTFLEGIIPNYLDMSWQLSEVGQAEKILKNMLALSEDNSILKGALLWITKADGDLVDIYRTLSQLLGRGTTVGIRCLHVGGQVSQSSGGQSIEGVAHILAGINAIIGRLSGAGFNPEDFIPKLHASIYCADHICLEIAHMRALRLCFKNLLKAHGIREDMGLFIDAYTAPQSYGDDVNYNRIKGALIGWAAAVGGADRISIRAGDDFKDAFDRRIARNINHLLKMESQIGWVADPTSGSYYIEAATSKIAESAWKRFKELDKEGAYYEGKSLVG